MSTTTSTPVTLSSSAISEIRRLMQEPDFDATQKLRVGVKGGDAAG